VGRGGLLKISIKGGLFSEICGKGDLICAKDEI
jgi:hypothetical protein